VTIAGAPVGEVAVCGAGHAMASGSEGCVGPSPHDIEHAVAITRLAIARRDVLLNGNADLGAEPARVGGRRVHPGGHEFDR
jgi:hypothetical protein